MYEEDICKKEEIKYIIDREDSMKNEDIDNIRSAMGTLPSQNPKKNYDYKNALETGYVGITDWPLNPMKNIVVAATSTWGDGTVWVDVRGEPTRTQYEPDIIYSRNSPDKIEIMLYTGIKDINEKEIYLNDLGYDKRNNLWRVDEIENTAGYGMTCISDSGAHEECYPQLLSYGWVIMHGLKIVGNKYSNPELIK